MTNANRHYLVGFLLLAVYAVISYALLGFASRTERAGENDVAIYLVAGPMSFLLPYSSEGANTYPLLIAYAITTIAAVVGLWVLLAKMQKTSLVVRALLVAIGWLGLGLIGFWATSNV